MVKLQPGQVRPASLTIDPSGRHIHTHVALEIRVEVVRQGTASTARILRVVTPGLPSDLQGKQVELELDRCILLPRAGETGSVTGTLVNEQRSRQAGRPGLVAGMPVEAFVRTSERTVMSYLVRPLGYQIARAFREK